MASNLKLVCIVIVCMAIIGAPLSTNAMLCGQFSDHFSSCVDFGRGLIGLDSIDPCCDGVRAIIEADTTAEAQKASCRCMAGTINIAMVLPNFPLQPSRLSTISPYCRASIPCPTSPSSDYDNIQTSISKKFMM